MEKIIVCFRHGNEKTENMIKELSKKLSVEVEKAKSIQGNTEHVLVLTDDATTANRCIRQKYACAAVLHEGNSREIFPFGMYCLEKAEEIEQDYFLKVYQRAKGIPWTILETSRLLLREMTVEDVPRLYELYREPEITRYMENLFADEAEETVYTREYIKNVYEFWGYGIWLVVKKDTGEIIGRAGVESKDAEEGLELGFMIGKAYQKQGYAYEICKAIIRYAQEELLESNIRAYVRKDNQASIGLCEKLGMVRSPGGPDAQSAYLYKYKESMVY